MFVQMGEPLASVTSGGSNLKDLFILKPLRLRPFPAELEIV